MDSKIIVSKHSVSKKTRLNNIQQIIIWKCIPQLIYSGSMFLGIKYSRVQNNFLKGG